MAVDFRTPVRHGRVESFSTPHSTPTALVTSRRERRPRDTVRDHGDSPYTLSPLGPRLRPFPGLFQKLVVVWTPRVRFYLRFTSLHPGEEPSEILSPTGGFRGA